MTPRAPRDWTRGQPGIVAYRCRACEHAFYFERGFCPSCGSRDITPGQSAGAGAVLARTLVHRAPNEALRSHLPYVLVLVRLEDGFTVMGQGDAALRIGDLVIVDFAPFGDAALVPFFASRESSP